MSEQNKLKARCGNCGKYPFCYDTNGASCYCDKWIKRNVEVEKANEFRYKHNSPKGS